MTHKVHPKIYRIREIKNWDSRWLSKKSFAKYLQEDFEIREFLNKKLKDASIQNIEIERLADKINIIVNTARPGLVIGRAGAGIEEIKKELAKNIFLKKKKIDEVKKEVRLEIREVKDPWLSSAIAAQWIAQQIEKRLRYRRVLKQALEKITGRKEVKGARIEVAGRLDGRTIAATEWLQKGRLPRQTIRADIDFARARAYCTYGVVGVKVWIYKGERLE